jgi:cytochrome c-type biogenesis protein CcmF
VPLLLAVPFGTMLAWKRGDALGAAQRLWAAALAAVIAIAIGFVAAGRGPHLAPFGIALGVWVMAGALVEIANRCKLGELSAAESWRRFTGLPRSAIGTLLAHFGVGLMVVGIVATTAYRSEYVAVMKPGDTAEIAGFTVTFQNAVPAQGPNYTEKIGTFIVARGAEQVAVLEPAKRRYDMPPQPTTEAGIKAFWRGDLYVVLGDEQDVAAGAYAVRMYFHPFVRCIWIGTLIMFLGGAVSLSDRRLRVGAPTSARGRVRPVPAE